MVVEIERTLASRGSGADPETFQSVGDRYYKDDTSVYYDGPEYNKIKPFEGRIDGADPASFEYIETGSETNYYAKDRAHVYLNWVSISDADPAIFVPSKHPPKTRILLKHPLKIVRSILDRDVLIYQILRRGANSGDGRYWAIMAVNKTARITPDVVEGVRKFLAIGAR